MSRVAQFASTRSEIAWIRMIRSFSQNEEKWRARERQLGLIEEAPRVAPEPAFSKPIFIPRVTYLEPTSLDRITESTGRKFELVQALGSSILSPESSLIVSVKRCAERVWIDLDTERMPNPIVGDRVGLQQLLDELRGSAGGTLQLKSLSLGRKDFVARSISFQKRYGATLIQAPSFDFSTTEERSFRESVAMAHETASQMDEPIVVKITTTETCIVQDEYRDEIVAGFSDVPVAFFYLTIQHSDEKTTAEIDGAYVALMLRLLAIAPTVPGKVGFFGLVCVGLGASGFGAGIAGVESHKRSVLSEGGGGQTSAKYHVDDVMMSLQPEVVDHLVLPNYPCRRTDCHCDGASASNLRPLNKQVHRVQRYRAHLDAMAALDAAGRRDYMSDMVGEAAKNRKKNGLAGTKGDQSVHETIWSPLLDGA